MKRTYTAASMSRAKVRHLLRKLSKAVRMQGKLSPVFG